MKKPQLDETDADAKKLIKNGEKMLHEGTISLQSESHPIEFRKVEILPLKPEHAPTVSVNNELVFPMRMIDISSPSPEGRGLG